jgi:hypothetical protein
MAFVIIEIYIYRIIIKILLTKLNLIFNRFKKLSEMVEKKLMYIFSLAQRLFKWFISF